MANSKAGMKTKTWTTINVSDAYTAQFGLWAESSGVGPFAMTTSRTE